MNILLARPYGYCYGVSKAMEIALKAKREHPKEEVFLIGAPVHNEDAISFLEKSGLTLLDGDFPSLRIALESLREGSVIVFSAHGHPRLFDEIAAKRGFTVYDGTCAFVQQNLLAALSSPSPVIYIGQSGHAERDAFLANSPSSYFIDAKTLAGDYESCPLTPSLIAQTTLSEEEIGKASARIRAKFPEARLIKERCTATKVRQEKVASLAKEADCAIILGSRSSNNARKLFDIASVFCPSWLCLDEKEVRSLDLSAFESVLVCSSASTSKEIVEETLSYLASL